MWKQCEEVKKAGLTKSIGVSNFRIKELEIILDGATVVPAINQVCTLSIKDLRRLASFAIVASD